MQSTGFETVTPICLAVEDQASPLKMEVVSSAEKLVSAYKSTRHYNPKHKIDICLGVLSVNLKKVEIRVNCVLQNRHGKN